jgi:hypothetical protein
MMTMTRSAAHTRRPDPDEAGPGAPYASKGKLDRIVGLVIVGRVTQPPLCYGLPSRRTDPT